MPSRPLALSLALALGALALAAPARAAEATVAVPGVPAAGPAKYDRTFVTRIGPSSARTVLVLVPGYIGGAGNFTLIGRELVDRVPGLQVWAVDRRSQALEDTSMFTRVVRGEATLQQLRDYYIGWIADPGIQPHFTPPDPRSLPFAARWGLPTALGDLRRVILRARRAGRRVILGGHSLGGSMTAIYATWDFAGRPGHRDVDGLVFIDGAAPGSFGAAPTVRATRRALRRVRKEPFADLLGLDLPWAAGIFVGIGARYAAEAPTEPSPLIDDPLLPAQFRPPARVTNRALLGYALDATTSPRSLALIHVRAGRLAPSGDPRDWADGEVSPVARVAEAFGASPGNGVEWYFPERLRVDAGGASALRRTAVTRLLKLRPWHLRGVDVPVYAFQTALSRGRVLRSARRFIARSRVPRRRSVLVDRSATTSHLDPLTAAPRTNDFLKTVVPFLRRVTRRP